TPGPASRSTTSPRCSSRTSPPSPRATASGSPLRIASSRITAAPSPWRARPGAGRPSGSRCRSPDRGTGADAPVSGDGTPAGPPAAVVARVDFGACVLLRDDGALLAARARGKLMGPRKSLGNAIVVGDRVHYDPPGSEAARGEEGAVSSVAPRRNW